MKRIFTTLMLIPALLFSQGLDRDRISNIKKCVVKVVVADGLSVGTGFLISHDGDVLTCWHVIQDAIVTDSLGYVLDVKKIYIEFADKSRIEMKIPKIYFQNKQNIDATVYDYCSLTPARRLRSYTDFLNLGSFDDVEEGDEVYTAGYPLGISDQFISKGILSSKAIDSSISFRGVKMKKNVALMDLTINRGNSGGPIIKLGKNYKDDKVIGIADFLLTKNGQKAEALRKEIERRKMVINIDDGKGNRLYLMDILSMFAESISYSSNGISGCLSIDHFLQSTK